MTRNAREFREMLRGRAAATAPMLLGWRLVRTFDDGAVARVRIVEVEAYAGVEDRAAHTFGGRRTARVESMWGEAGLAYVYFTYGMHHCMNVVVGGEGVPEAVLIRACEPMDGIDRLRAERGARRRARSALSVNDLCSGPAKLCAALAVDRGHDGVDLLATDSPLRLERVVDGAVGVGERVARGPRIGIPNAGSWRDAPLRWWLEGNAHVSR
jgi:DNA-3-methyladenine glycosylase